MNGRLTFLVRFLRDGFIPAHGSFFPAALVRQQNGAHRLQRLLRRYLQRDAFLDRVAHIGVEVAIVAALRLHTAAGRSDHAESPPEFFRIDAPVRSPVLALGKFSQTQRLFLRIHPIFHESSLGSVKQVVSSGSKRNNAPTQQGTSSWIFQEHIERIVHYRSRSLANRPASHCLWFSE